uniref:Alpha-1,3-glucosyltransferase n=1 Tax=Aceria tosichella TaxID=561515 RepID=A0A6G1SPC8_9ACAR
MSSARALPVGLVSVAILIRWLVAQYPYSGYQKPPMYGDYEAQRHWMEITTNLPVRDWYKNTKDNDLLYWGLDYPPLTAYHMYILGRASNKFYNSSWTELRKSRGLESYDHKIFMRSTVLLSELLIYFPAVIYYFYYTQPIQYKSPPTSVHRHNIAIYCSLVLLYPAQILIDHGHFQYNSVFMGLVLWAIIFMIKGCQLSSAVAFTLALGYKQMSLYYALPFFWYIASTNLRKRPLWKGFFQIIIVGLTVLGVFAALFAPYLYSLQATLQVVQRIFPFNRGLFEDKVANFWFSLSIFYKFKNFYSLDKLLQASTGLTLMCSLPAGLHLLFRPTIRTFKYALVTTSMGFFLFSFQVHEKTILVPALPLLLLCREHPMAANWFVIVSTFSLQPLLMRDGQLVPYLVLMIMFTLMSLETFSGLITLSPQRIFTFNNLVIVTYLTSILTCFILSVAAIFVPPPTRYPYIHPTINALFSCGQFIGFLLFFYYKQFRSDSSQNVAIDRNYLLKKTN